MSPRPQLMHQQISKKLTRLLDDCLPDGLVMKLHEYATAGIEH